MQEYKMLGFFLTLICFSVILTCDKTQAQTVSTTTPRNGEGCVYTVTASSGYITTPNYPSRYSPNAACKWTIKVPSGSLIELSFDNFLIQKSRSCRRDYLLLFDGPNASSRKVGRYCGRVHPEKFTSSFNAIYLEFYSDKSLNYQGFYASYKTKSPPTTKPTIWRSRPKFVHPPKNITVREGQLLKMTCIVQGSPEPTIIWQRNLQNLTNDEDTFFEDSRLKSVLSIKKVTISDHGMYTCVVFNGVGEAIKSDSWVKVKKRVLPLISKTTKNQTVHVGSNITLFCNATGPPPLAIRWSENAKKLAQNKCQTSPSCWINLKRKFFTTTVVTCEVINKAGNVTRNVLVNVKGPPIITIAPKDEKAEVGAFVNFSCEAIGIPPIAISWMKDNETVFSGITTENRWSQFTFNATKNTTVTCNAKDKDGTTSKHAQLIVTELIEPPTITRIPLTFIVKPLDVNLDHQSTINLQCKAKGFPEPQISWMRDGVNITKNASLANGTSTLKLQPIDGDSSTVICIAINVLETIQSIAIITYFSEPSIKHHKSGKFNKNMKVVIAVVGGLLMLTILIIIFLARRWSAKKKNAELAERARESETFVLNPPYSNQGDGSNSKRGIEMLHVPPENIVLSEDVDDEIGVHMYLGCATDLPFTKPGEHRVLIRALKDTSPSEEKKDEFAMEASSLVNLVHPNVVRLMAVSIKAFPLSLVFECSEYGYLDEYLRACDGLLLAQLDNGENDHLHKLDNVDRISIAKQIAAGMQYLTEKGHVHQRLRAHSCMVFNNLQVKVTNLGLRWDNPEQNFFDMDFKQKQKLPVRWLSPEVILYGSYSVSADVWSYGVVMCEIFSNGQQPYSGIDNNDVIAYVRGGNIIPRPKLCPHEIYEVMKSCWEITPCERPGFESLVESISSFHDMVPELHTNMNNYDQC